MEKKSYNVKIYDSYLYKNLKDKKSKIIPFNTVKNDLGNIRYFPPTIREWKNSIYTYNQNYMKNLPAEWSGKSLMRVKLSNSEDSLKLLIPNDNLKIIRGWINYLCKVINQKMIEKVYHHYDDKYASL